LQYNKHSLRHELKYIISFRDYHELRTRALTFMRHDEHGNDGKYFIRSLYLDDILLSDYNQKMDGWSRRRKYRIRVYDLGEDVIKFEIKDKYDSCISKVSDTISMDEYERIVFGDFDFVSDMIFSDSDEGRRRALRMAYVDNASKILSPQVVVDYDREVFVCEEGNVRMTFDMNLRAGLASWDLFDPELPTVPAYDEGCLILEVKYDDFLPDFIRHMLRPLGRWQSSQSKYAMCCLAQANYFGRDVY
jgi:VTC domain.